MSKVTLFSWLKDDHRRLHKIGIINGVAVSEVIEDKAYLLTETESEYYTKKLKETPRS